MDAFQVVYSVGNQGLRPKLPKICPNFVDIITNSWEDDPSDRPPVDELLKKLTQLPLISYPFFTEKDSESSLPPSSESPPKNNSPYQDDFVGTSVKPNVTVQN
jgi:hypothetical protein